MVGAEPRSARRLLQTPKTTPDALSAKVTTPRRTILSGDLLTSGIPIGPRSEIDSSALIGCSGRRVAFDALQLASDASCKDQI